jgi:LacI family transcriptional regulator
MNRFRIVIRFNPAWQFDRELTRGISAYLKEHNLWQRFAFFPEFSGKAKDDLKDTIRRWNPHGMIIRPFPKWEYFKTSGIPIIVAPVACIEKHVTNILVDDAEIARTAAEYLMSRGYRNFAFLGNRDFFWSNAREKHFEEIIRGSGLRYVKLPRVLQCTNWSKQPEALAKWLLQMPRPIAFFTATDELSRVLAQALNLTTLRCPDDLAILGVHNDELICDFTHPQLSSIGLQAEQAGYQAIRAMVHSLLENRPLEGDIINPSTLLVERQSTNALATGDQEIRKALIYVHNAPSLATLKVSEIVQSGHISRRSLEMRFRKQTGQTLKQYIENLRLKQVTQMMDQTGLSIKEIAHQCEFFDTASLTRFVKRHTGYSPARFRNRYK